jgi:hypothetical protein
MELLQAYLREFGPEQAAVDAEFFTRVSFFDLLEVPERREILNKRLAHLQKVLQYLHSLQQMARESEDCANILPSRSPAERVLAFHLRRIHDEYEWIAAWLAEMQTGTSSAEGSSGFSSDNS